MPVARPYVVIHVASLLPGDQKIVITNTSRSATQTLNLNPFSVILGPRVILEGTTNDQYTVAVFGLNSPDPAHPSRPLTPAVVPYDPGTGNLLLTALPGTFDPTRLEIEHRNAVVPPDQQVAVNGVKRIVIFNNTQGSGTVILDVDAGIVGQVVDGGLVFGVDGGFSDSYTVTETYEDGHDDEVRLPTFRIHVTNSSTGQSTTIVGQSPPREEPLYVDLSGGIGPPTLLSTPDRFVGLDPHTPLTLEFSRPLDPATVAAHAAVFQVDGPQAGMQVAGVWTSLSGGRIFAFTPNAPLRMGARLSVTLNGVTDVSGKLLASTTVQVTTFKPTRLSSTCIEQLGAAPCVPGSAAPGLAPLPVKDVGILRQRGADDNIHTRVEAITSNQLGFKLHSIDVTDPTHPEELGHTAGGSFKRRLALAPNLTLAGHNFSVVYDVQISCLSSRRCRAGPRVERWWSAGAMASRSTRLKWRQAPATGSNTKGDSARRLSVASCRTSGWSPSRRNRSRSPSSSRCSRTSARSG